MDVDPIDGGPKDLGKGLPPPPPKAVPMQISEEEEARQAIDMFRGDDMSARVKAANRLEAIASVLGEQRTREVCTCLDLVPDRALFVCLCLHSFESFAHLFVVFSLTYFFELQELLPFVTDGTDDEDEVLLALANSLGKLIPLVGGGSHAHTLLPPLELLLTVEENSVREAASASTKLVATTLPQDTFLEKYVPMLGRLANKEWFTARISAAGLIADAYPRLKVLQQQEHLVMFAELCQDDTPMVRRVAAQSLGKMVENVVQASGRSSLEEGGMVTSILMPLYETLSSNEQPVSNNKTK